jgi:NADPH2:quinone reductase
MRAIVIDRFGGPDQLHSAEIDTPEPQSGEVLIKIEYTSVNPVDWKIREGMLASLFPHDFPLIPGWDAAGTVAAVGDGVRPSAVGEHVYAYCRKPRVQWGTYAEYVTMSAAAVAPMPQVLSFAEAAGIPLVGLTSWQALFDVAHLEAGQSVLILNGAGGTGSLAIPFAKHAGARVIVCASAGNHEYLRSLGADVLIDYRNADVIAEVKAHAPEGVDVIYANMGGEPHRQSYALLKAGGTLVTIVDKADEDAAKAVGATARYHFVEPDGGQLREIARLIEAGFVKPPQMTVMKLEEAAEAHRLSEGHHVRGKIALAVT